MATLGTRKFYKNINNTSAAKNQILKNSGYISIVLHSAFYHSKGNFWQTLFGGRDKIALSSTVTYKSSGRTIEAKSIVDKREVKANRNHELGLSRLLALKVPATADGIEMKVELTAVKDDNFENGLNLMNSPEFQKPLQLASVPVGEILSITNVVKKIFTGVKNPSILEATFAGIISQDKVDQPIQKERLTAGYLIMIANNDEDNAFLSKVDESKFSVEGDGLKYDGKLVTHTNLVFSITFESLKGVDEKALWFKDKYMPAINKLNDILISMNPEEHEKILADARKLWIEGNALLFSDDTYISDEKFSISQTFFKKIKDRYTALTKVDSNKVVNFFVADMVSSPLQIEGQKSITSKKVFSNPDKIAEQYLKKLGAMNMVFPS